MSLRACARKADTAIGRVRTTESLYAFSRKLAGTATLDDVLWATAYQTALMLKVRVVLLLPEAGVLTVKSGGLAHIQVRDGFFMFFVSVMLTQFAAMWTGRAVARVVTGRA